MTCPLALAWIATPRRNPPGPALASVADAIIALASRHVDRTDIAGALWAVLPGASANGRPAQRRTPQRPGNLRRRRTPPPSPAPGSGGPAEGASSHSGRNVIPPLLTRGRRVAARSSAPRMSPPLVRRARRCSPPRSSPSSPGRDAVLAAARAGSGPPGGDGPRGPIHSLETEHANVCVGARSGASAAAAPPTRPIWRGYPEQLAARSVASRTHGAGLNALLICDEHRRDARREIQPDIRSLQGWRRMPAEYGSARISAAERYCDPELDPEPDPWFGTDTQWQARFAGYRALYLGGGARSQAWLDALSATSRERWAPGDCRLSHDRIRSTTSCEHDTVMERALAAYGGDGRVARPATSATTMPGHGSASGSGACERPPSSTGVWTPSPPRRENASLPRRRPAAGLLELVLGRDRLRRAFARASNVWRARRGHPTGDDARTLTVAVASTALRLAFRDTWPLGSRRRHRRSGPGPGIL